MRTKTSRFLLGLSALSLLMAALVLVPNMRSAEAQSASIEQTQLGNIFTVGATPAFDIRTSSSEVTWAAHDYWGTEVASGTEQVSDGTLRLETPVEDPGFYRLRVSVGEAEQMETVETTFAVVPEATPPADDDFVFGMQTHFAQGWETDLVPLLKLAGVESVRDQLTWAEIEATKGEYNFEGKFDTYVKALDDSGIELLANFGISNPNYDDGATPYSDEGQAGYARFVQEVVKHYDTEVEEISVYNEPNLARFGDHGDGPADATPENYFNLLRRTHEAVNQVDPDVTMAGPEVLAAQTLSYLWNPWLTKFFELGGLEYVDAFSLHPYRDQCCTPEGLDGDIETVRELLGQYGGGDKPIWITEQGWTTHLNTEEEQAAYIPRTFTQAQKAGVDRFHWFNLMDNNGREHGLLHEPGDELGAYTPKPAYVSYAVMTNQMSGWKYQSSDDSNADIQNHTFTKGDSEKRVLWAPEGERTVGLSANEPVEVTDTMGATRTLEPHGGRVTLTLTDDPLYVTGEVSSIGNYTEFRMRSRSSSATDTVPTTLELDNGSSFWWTGKFEIAGKTYTIETEPGDYIDKHVEVAASGSEGRRAVRAEVEINGKLTGWLTSQVDVVPDVDVRLVPRVTDDGETSMAVEITNNHRKTEYTVEDFDWKVDEESGTEQRGDTLPPGASVSVPISLAQKDNWVQYPSEITVRLADLPALQESGEIGFNPAARQSLTVDGDLGELADTPHLDLTEHGKVKWKAGEPYGGPKDLSGPIWLTADKDNLYVAAEITDDVHYSGRADQAMRESDGILLALAKGVPADARGTRDYYEYIVSRTESDGPAALRNRAPDGEDTGPAKNVQVEVKRDEANNKTIYEFAIPWGEMEQISFDDGVVSASLLTTDNDGNSRADVEGSIEWGSGINGGKLPSLYRAVDVQRGCTSDVCPG